jgi:hypothetical protein
LTIHHPISRIFQSFNFSISQSINQKNDFMKTSFAIRFVTIAAVSFFSTAAFSQSSAHSGQAAHAPSAPMVSPYAGEQRRDIKSLSASDVTALQTGAGMAYAKAAELNGYPGPAHVLELATALQLDSAQRTATERLLVEHKERARATGIQLLAAERELDMAFSLRKADPKSIDALTRKIGVLQASLRAEHLQTHLAQTSLLHPQQVASYQTLRGYGSPDAVGITDTH